MKASIKLSLTAFGQGAIELFFYLPVLLTASVYLLPASAVWVWILTLPLCYSAASVLMKLLTKLRLIVKLLLAAAVGGAHAYCFIDEYILEIQAVPVLICGFIGAVTAARGMSVVMRGWNVSFSNWHLIFGVLTYIAVQPLKVFSEKKLIDYNGLLIICGIAAVILLFLL